MTAKSLLIGALAIAGLAAAPASASAQGFLDGVLGLLGVAPEKPPIEYRERAPLVVPRSQQQLPEPQAPRARGAAWPNDPDVAARRQADADRNAPVVRNENPTMSPRALRAGPRTATNNYSGLPLGAAPENSNSSLVIGPTFQMNAIDAARERSLSNLQPGEEPERKALTEPPSGYRKPTEVVRTKTEPVRQVDSASTRDYVIQQRQR